MPQSLEALYTVEFGDIAGGAFRNGGVAILETLRVFGGDSGYYYLGDYSVAGEILTASVKVVKHNAMWANVFGDAATEFNIQINGVIREGSVTGFMERIGMPGVRLPVRLIRRADLP